MAKRIVFIVLLFFLAPSLAWGAVQVKDIRSSTDAVKTRFVFDLTGPVKYRLFTLSSPERLVIDIDNATLEGRLDNLSLARSPVKEVRSGHPMSHTLRIVFDLKREVLPKSFVLEPMAGNGYRLVIDLFHGKTLAASKRSRTRPARIKAKPQKTEITVPVTAKITSPVPKRLRKIIVVIDPGHGGRDPGATGRGGHHEKTVVLKVAKDLQQMLNKEPGFKADLTRRSDYYIPLRGRLTIARKDNADMFISIHADAYKNANAHGASVFALSERGATSEAARWLATSENRSELTGGVDLENKDTTLRSVLINLAQTHTIAVSLQMGNSILQQLGTMTRLHHSRVEQAAFVVLKSPDIPSLLVETGFLSTPSEERRLINANYRHTLARAIMLGIKGYFMQHPPPGTYLAAWKSNSQKRA